MFIDTHLHLDMFDEDRAAILLRAREAGVRRLITIGTDLPSSRTAIEIAAEESEIYATVGIHPHEVAKRPEDAWERLEALATRQGVVAIGEIGLDFHYMHAPRQRQIDDFAEQLARARKLDLPVVVHSREAEAETLAILEESGVEEGVIHCFTGSLSMARRALDLGFFISFSGIVTFKKAHEVQEVARFVPLDRLLFETDAPYLAPVPERGKRNEPAFVVHTARFLAMLKSLPLETLATEVSRNAARLFRLPEGMDPETEALAPQR
ncbi:MAG: TatD family deoxyribonuclease [Deltaproteobacteria bacterium]|nr:MAG: TatD family deoxyribonuclease [Deltaproteobacteria bacterium]